MGDPEDPFFFSFKNRIWNPDEIQKIPIKSLKSRKSEIRRFSLGLGGGGGAAARLTPLLSTKMLFGEVHYITWLDNDCHKKWMRFVIFAFFSVSFIFLRITQVGFNVDITINQREPSIVFFSMKQNIKLNFYFLRVPMCCATVVLRRNYAVAAIGLWPVIAKNYGVITRNYDGKIVVVRSYADKNAATRCCIVVIQYRSLLYTHSSSLIFWL